MLRSGSVAAGESRGVCRAGSGRIRRELASGQRPSPTPPWASGEIGSQVGPTQAETVPAIGVASAHVPRRERAPNTALPVFGSELTLPTQ